MYLVNFYSCKILRHVSRPLMIPLLVASIRLAACLRRKKAWFKIIVHTCSLLSMNPLKFSGSDKYFIRFSFPIISLLLRYTFSYGPVQSYKINP